VGRGTALGRRRHDRGREAALGQEALAPGGVADGAGASGRTEEPSADPRDAVVEAVGQGRREHGEGDGEDPPRAPREAKGLAHGRRANETPPVGHPEDEAVGEPLALVRGDERLEGDAPEGGVAQGGAAVEGEEQADRRVAQPAAAVVEEDGGAQGVSARSAATRASMLATDVSPSRR
jgi:hypothetical protein